MMNQADRMLIGRPGDARGSHWTVEKARYCAKILGRIKAPPSHSTCARLSEASCRQWTPCEWTVSLTTLPLLLQVSAGRRLADMKLQQWSFQSPLKWNYKALHTSVAFTFSKA
ncbi:hypothetical protein ATANTOWER_004830 [Ataeniobius toweri]|uniref:Uncharacterized protein n=1 Tax=Ataeniobius toweri TaxID=208326 RepID=A0ABU7A4E0_9TELE|nr:hypothetical protein [Ataeniobius toweri]